VAERQVRFTEQFFEALDERFPTERGADGTPSATDFLLIDLPAVRDRLANDFDRWTLPTTDQEVRVCIGAGILVERFALFAALVGDVVEVFWLTMER
jgi:hypothetical protein